MLGLALALTLSMQSYGQNKLGLGLRFGDPTGISIKKYLSKNALEFNLGRSYDFYNGNGYYNNYFDNWYKDKKFGYADYQYLGYKHQFPLTFQARYLWQKGIGKVGKENLSGLDWYLGAGVQFRYRSYAYNYRYKVGGDPNWYYVNEQRVNDLDLGLDGILGLEYTFKEIPISVFADINLFMELVDNPFWFYFQGGSGVRYNF